MNYVQEARDLLVKTCGSNNAVADTWWDRANAAQGKLSEDQFILQYPGLEMRTMAKAAWNLVQAMKAERTEPKQADNTFLKMTNAEIKDSISQASLLVNNMPTGMKMTQEPLLNLIDAMAGIFAKFDAEHPEERSRQVQPTDEIPTPDEVPAPAPIALERSRKLMEIAQEKFKKEELDFYPNGDLRETGGKANGCYVGGFIWVSFLGTALDQERHYSKLPLKRWSCTQVPSYGRLLRIDVGDVFWWTKLEEGESWFRVSNEFFDNYDPNLEKALAVVLVDGLKIANGEFTFAKKGQ